MTTTLGHYLEDIRNNLRLDQPVKHSAIAELEAHIQDEIEDLKQKGLSEEEASRTCVRLLGSAKTVARQIYEAHSQGTWQQTLLACMPHLLLALLFVLNWWHAIVWLTVSLVIIFGMAVYGWWRGKPTWLFPWLGCCLLPVIVAGTLFLYLPRVWSWIAIAVYVPLALWLICAITLKIVRKDWLYSAMMLTPVPIIIAWYVATKLESNLFELSLEDINNYGQWIGLTFLVLAGSVAVFIRSRQRWLKGTALLIPGLVTLILMTCYIHNRLGWPVFITLVLALLGLFGIPALLEHRIRYLSTSQYPNAKDTLNS